MIYVPPVHFLFLFYYILFHSRCLERESHRMARHWALAMLCFSLEKKDPPHPAGLQYQRHLELTLGRVCTGMLLWTWFQWDKFMCRIILDSKQDLNILIFQSFKTPTDHYCTALIKTAKYGWNVTDELFLKATCYRLSGRTAAFHLFLCRSATKNSREGYGWSNKQMKQLGFFALVIFCKNSLKNGGVCSRSLSKHLFVSAVSTVIGHCKYPECFRAGIMGLLLIYKNKLQIRCHFVVSCSKLIASWRIVTIE